MVRVVLTLFDFFTNHWLQGEGRGDILRLQLLRWPYFMPWYVTIVNSCTSITRMCCTCILMLVIEILYPVTSLALGILWAPIRFEKTLLQTSRQPASTCSQTSENVPYTKDWLWSLFDVHVKVLDSWHTSRKGNTSLTLHLLQLWGCGIQKKRRGHEKEQNRRAISNRTENDFVLWPSTEVQLCWKSEDLFRS